MDTKKACIITFLGFILAIAGLSLAQFDFDNKLSPPPTPCTNFTFLQSFGGNSTICNTVPLQGTLTYFFDNQTSQNTINASKRMLATPNSTEFIITYSNLINNNSLQNWTTKQGTPSLTFIPSGDFTVHIHASASQNNQVHIFANIWEVNNTGGYLNLIGTTEHELLTTTEQQYNMIFHAANTTFLNSSSSRLMVQIIPHILVDNPSVTLFFGGSADSKLILPSVSVDATNFVPYTGATQDVNLGTHNLTVNNITSPDITNIDNNIIALQKNDTYQNSSIAQLQINDTYLNGTVFPQSTNFRNDSINGTIIRNNTAHYKIVTTTHDTSITGDQAITGAGFKPSAGNVMAVVRGTSKMSTGFFDNSVSYVAVATGSTTVPLYFNLNNDIIDMFDGTNDASAAVKSIDADGITITWSKVNSPTGTATIFVMFER